MLIFSSAEFPAGKPEERGNQASETAQAIFTPDQYQLSQPRRNGNAH
jgi:hypothetical protein